MLIVINSKQFCVFKQVRMPCLPPMCQTYKYYGCIWLYYMYVVSCCCWIEAVMVTVFCGGRCREMMCPWSRVTWYVSTIGIDFYIKEICFEERCTFFRHPGAFTGNIAADIIIYNGVLLLLLLRLGNRIIRAQRKIRVHSYHNVINNPVNSHQWRRVVPQQRHNQRRPGEGATKNISWLFFS